MKASELNMDLTNERKQFAVMIGMYFGAMSDDDTLVTINKIIDFANNHDFDMSFEDGEWVINTEMARYAAWEYVKEII